MCGPIWVCWWASIPTSCPASHRCFTLCPALCRMKATRGRREVEEPLFFLFFFPLGMGGNVCFGDLAQTQDGPDPAEHDKKFCSTV